MSAIKIDCYIYRLNSKYLLDNWGTIVRSNLGYVLYILVSISTIITLKVSLALAKSPICHGPGVRRWFLFGRLERTLILAFVSSRPSTIIIAINSSSPRTSCCGKTTYSSSTQPPRGRRFRSSVLSTSTREN